MKSTGEVTWECIWNMPDHPEDPPEEVRKITWEMQPNGYLKGTRCADGGVWVIKREDEEET